MIWELWVPLAITFAVIGLFFGSIAMETADRGFIHKIFAFIQGFFGLPAIIAIGIIAIAAFIIVGAIIIVCAVVYGLIAVPLTLMGTLVKDARS